MTELNQTETTRSTIKRMTVEVTTRCNYDCRHCSNRPLKPGQDATVDTDRLVEVVLEARALGCHDFLLTGGEPLLWPDFERFYLRLQQIPRVTVRINSNGSLISERIARLLAAHPPAKMHISVYGWDAASYERIVGRRGVFAQFAEGVGRVRKNRIPFLFLIPGIGELVKNYDKVNALAYKLGGRRKLVWGYMLSSHVDPSARSRNQGIRALRLSPADAAAAILRERDGLEKQLRLLRSPRPRDFRYMFSCLRTYPQYVVDARMNLLPCITLRHPDYVFSLMDSSLKSGLKFIDGLSCLPYNDTRVYTRCTGCKIRGLCKHCPANSFIENGNPEGIAEYYCALAHEIAQYLGRDPEDANNTPEPIGAQRAEGSA